MLLTRRGAERLARADAVVYDGLVNAAILELLPEGCEPIYAGKKHTRGSEPLTQKEISERLVALGRAGKRVVRLKGGDPFVFGRGGEECRALAAAGVPFEIVPGVTSATAAPAYAGIPLTDRDCASTVAFATGHQAAGKPESDIDWQAIARADTVVLFMALKTARECADRLIRAGRDPETPAAAIYWGTTVRQRTVVAPLGGLGGAVERANLVPPVLLVVGEVVRQRDALQWFERSPLFGLRVAVTRRREQANEIVRALSDLGAEPIVLPVTRLAPASADEMRAARQELGRLDAYDWLLFASANGVRAFFAELADTGRDARALGGIRVACVGDKTAEELRRFGVRADVVPSRDDATGAAEAMIDAGGVDLQGSRVLIARASGGRQEAVSVLRRAGAKVVAIQLYRSEPTGADDPAVRRALDRLRAGEIDVIALFAPSQVRALFDALGEGAIDTLASCRAIAAIGETTRAELTRRGLSVQVVPARATATALAEALAAYALQKES